MAYEEEKDYMKKSFCATGFGDEDGGGSTYVTACTFHTHQKDGKLLNKRAGGQACHMTVRYAVANLLSSGLKTEVMLDHIQGASREKIGKLQTPEESVRYLQYFMDHPIFSKSFLEHDAQVAFDERIMVRDLNSLPANTCMFAIIATRALWEQYQYKLPHRFCVLVDAGLSPDFAFIMAHYVGILGIDNYVLDPILNTGHVAIASNLLGCEAVKNYLNHVTPVVANGTLAAGFNWLDDKVNVFSTFENKFVQTYGSRRIVDTFKGECDTWFSGHRLSNETLVQFEEYLRGKE